LKTKLQLVLENIKLLGLTAYEIGKATNLNTAGIQKIIDGKSEKPREATLNLILNYIETKKVGSAIPGHHNYNEAAAEESLKFSEVPIKYGTSEYEFTKKLMLDFANMENEVFRLRAILDKHDIKY